MDQAELPRNGFPLPPLALAPPPALAKTLRSLAMPLRSHCGTLAKPLWSHYKALPSTWEAQRSPCGALAKPCEAPAKPLRRPREAMQSPCEAPRCPCEPPLKPLQIGPLNCRGLVICCGLLNCCGLLTCSRQQNCCGLLSCRGQFNGREMPYSALIAHRWLAKIFPIFLQKNSKK